MNAARSRTTGEVELPAVGTVVVTAAKPWWSNYKTLAFNIGAAMALAGVTALSTVDWTQYVSPTVAIYLVLGINTVLRVFTNGPVASPVVIKKVEPL